MTRPAAQGCAGVGPYRPFVGRMGEKPFHADGWSSCRAYLQQRLGLLEVGRVKAFRESAVYLRQQLSDCCVLPLILPEPSEA